MIYLLECDLKGLSSVSSAVATGQITVLPCPTFQAYQNQCKALLGKVTSNDLVIVDTLTSLLETTRQDATLGVEGAEDLWEARSKWLHGDKAYLAKYDYAGQVTTRWMKNLSARGARVIIICHEAEVIQEVGGMKTKMQGPDVNPALVNKLIGMSSDVFRLVSLTTPITDAEGKEVLKRDDRILYLRRTDEFVAKYSVPIERSPHILNGLPHPTLPKVYEHLGTKPPVMLLYGHPGAGKTTFAVSEVELKAKEKA